MSHLLQTYKTAALFLAETEQLLLRHELENNLVLGIACGMKHSEIPHPDMNFVTIRKDGSIRLFALTRNSKAILSGAGCDQTCLELLKTHYRQCGIRLNGVMGEETLAKSFSELFIVSPAPSRKLILHELMRVNNLKPSPGELIQAESIHLELASTWLYQFFLESNTYPVRSEAECRSEAVMRIERNDLWFWVVDGEVRSMAGTVRKTHTVAFLGLVYTPADLRGKGYASSCVQFLSAHLLKTGFQSCGLFTEKSNPVSNRIYQRIGYVPSVEFDDIQFVF